MQRKERGDDGAAPEKAGGGAEQVKKKNDIERMKRKAGGMMSGGMQAEELDVGHVGDPGERMPVGHDGGAERPDDVVEREAGLQKAILGNVAVVVVIDETVGEGGPVGKDGDRDQEKREQPRLSRIVGWR